MLPRQWILQTLLWLLEKLTSEPAPIKGARLCLIVMQGIVLLLSDTNTVDDTLRKMADDLESWVSQTNSSCLRSMMKQLNAGLSDVQSIGQLKWLSDFDDSTINRRLDSTNSALSAGSSLIADESGLFFLLHADILSAFTLDDVEMVLWDVSPANPVLKPATLYFHKSSLMNTDPLVISKNAYAGRALDWIVQFMRPKYRIKIVR
ncbi:MAG: hypothetical protein Q9224_006963 [Gallowayella concinna]